MAQPARDSTSTSDGDLVKAVLRGELSAFDELVRRYQRQAVAVAYRKLNNREDALEISQDAMLKAYDKLDSLHNHDRFGSWLLRIVSNLSLNRRRSRALRKTASLDIENPDSGRNEINLPDSSQAQPDQQVTGQELRGLIAEKIEQLPEKQQQALVLFSLQKMPQKEVAEIMGISVEAVKWHVFTARKKLKDELQQYL
ncbi:MAG: RNA polymerase sigma factor [Phycisphaerae bacterium]